jgi:ElaB/YqjD/DUF883 family membrane-anchored ribosome-binding protein
MSTEPVTTAILMEDLQTVVRDAEALLKATAAQTGEKIQEVRARTEESLRQAKARLVEVQGDVLQRARAAADVAESYVKSNPWQSVSAAALVGLVVGLLLRSRD